MNVPYRLYTLFHTHQLKHFRQLIVEIDFLNDKKSF